MNRTNYSPPNVTPVATQPRRWGLRSALLGGVFLTLSIPGLGWAAGQKQNPGGPDQQTLVRHLVHTMNCAAEIRDALDRAAILYPDPLKGATWSRVARLEGIDNKIYHVRGKNARGRTIEAEITRAGRVIEIEEFGVPFSEVPTPVMEAVKVKIPNANPDWVVAIYQAGNPGPVIYGFTGRDANSNEVKVYLTADGKMFLN